MPPGPIDPLTGPKLALAGRVVCMDNAFTVIARGVVYVEQGRVAAVQERAAPPPPGFAGVPVTTTGGTIYPGLIELHNHLAYNILTPWPVTRRYGNRGQWPREAAYETLISGPMKVVGKTPALLPAVSRYVECKCLLGGVTTSQGIRLSSNQGASKYYKGIVRNVEQTDDPELPEAATRIPDLSAGLVTEFLARLEAVTCFLLHLSEGTDASARRHFEALQFEPGRWALRRSLAGIHCVALTAADFQVMAAHGAAMVWSPLSNLLLYGATADVAAARRAGVRMGLGSDWSPSGSKNLLGELKVAHLVSENLGGVFSDRDLVAMATRDAAAIVGWQAALGSLEPGKRADLLVVAGTAGDPYSSLIRARETAIRLVMINGVARYGAPGLMRRLGAAGESVRVAGRARLVFLDQATQDPAVQAVSLAQARATLHLALGQLPQLAAGLTTVTTLGAAAATEMSLRAAAAAGGEVWTLALDEVTETGMDMRPRLPLPGTSAATGPVLLGPATLAAPAALQPLALDGLTAADDRGFLPFLRQAMNLPQYVKDGLSAML